MALFKYLKRVSEVSDQLASGEKEQSIPPKSKACDVTPAARASTIGM
jgi:hypothetical protein